MEPRTISVTELKKRMDGGERILFIDTRSQAAWDASDIKITGAIRIHYGELERHVKELPHRGLIVAYCT